MFAQQHQAIPHATQVQVRVPERVQITRTTQALSSGRASRGILTRVMHQHHRQIQFPLQGTEVGQ